MAWTAAQDFNEVSDGNLTGNASGTGWSVAWAGAGTTNLNDTEFKVDTVAVLEGTRAVHIDCASTSAYIQRSLTTPISAGTVYFYIRAAQTNRQCLFKLSENTGTDKMLIAFKTDGNIGIYDNGSASYVAIQAYSANTWYLIAIDFNDGTNNNQYRASVNNGAYTSYKTVNGGSYSTIGFFGIEHSATSGADFYMDYITGTNISQQTSSVSDTVNLSDVSKYGFVKSVSDTVNLSDSTRAKNGFGNQAKSSSTWTNQQKS